MPILGSLPVLYRAAALVFLFVSLLPWRLVVAQSRGELEMLAEEECPCHAPSCPHGYRCTCEGGGGGCEGTKMCYTPVCPAGYWKCCFDCASSTCARRAHELLLSNRGVLECLPCTTGDYCAGCDTFTECDPEQRKSPYGKVYSIPGISPPAAVFSYHCQRCAPDFEADLERRRCVLPFRGDCDMDFLSVCLDKCPQFLTDPAGMEECAKHQCVLDCAGENQNKKCLAGFQDTCQELNRAVDTQELNAGGPLLTSTDAPFLSDDSGIATVSPLEGGCKLKCSSGSRTHGGQMPVVRLCVATMFLVWVAGVER